MSDLVRCKCDDEFEAKIEAFRKTRVRVTCTFTFEMAAGEGFDEGVLAECVVDSVSPEKLIADYLEGESVLSLSCQADEGTEEVISLVVEEI